MVSEIVQQLQSLAASLEGDLHVDTVMRTLYATDASAYREMPLAVCIPKSESDISKLIQFALEHNTALIPRTAGTSLAGQVVGSGIVVDVSKHFNKIISIDAEKGTVVVQPGVIRDELNSYLKPYGWYFAPETSTANRAMIGGMVGNNSCGANSIVYGTTREHLLEAKGFLSDGTFTSFNTLTLNEFEAKCEQDNLEGHIYNSTRHLLGNAQTQAEIRQAFPKPQIKRRNTGYAVDILIESAPFNAGGEDFNFCKLIAGSEGTLFFLTELTLHLVPLPPAHTALLCVHFNSVNEALRANLIAVQYQPSASELIDHYILECTKENIEQSKNRFFVQGDPGAILVIEFSKNAVPELEAITLQVIDHLKQEGLGYHFPVLYGADTKKIWNLRKAGLGLLSNLPGDEKAVPVIEDTAVAVEDLPEYIAEFNAILAKHGLYSVHYAHAGAGELHLRPIINLKTSEGNRLFRVIAEEVALLVKKYRGSLSGEHGDGRLRGEFIQWMIGDNNYTLLKQLKDVWDPKHIFNPNKIVDTPPMHTFLRYKPDHVVPPIETVFRFNGQNILQHAEQCNGSGDCRKTPLSGGTMCPSFMATRNEKDTTRARANILREFLTNSTKANRFDHPEIYEVMDLCLSCKGCKSECPSNVDVAKLKAEFLQHYYDANGVPFRTKIIANFTSSSALGSIAPWLYNTMVTAPAISPLIKKTIGFAEQRSMPTLYKQTLKQWYAQHKKEVNPDSASRQMVYFFCDEFTNYNDTAIGIKAILLLEKLGYQVFIPKHIESGRTWLSKGLLRKAKAIANSNVDLLAPIINEATPLIGIEPSAILTLKDEYLDLVDEDKLPQAKQLAKNSYLIDAFIAKAFEEGNITSSQFTNISKKVYLHGHCQQKAMIGVGASVNMLSIPANYSVQTIPSGCCGMAGSFGFEKEHYDLSMKIGEMVLFPAVRKATNQDIIAAPGTSCRHQIKDGTGIKAKHPVEILYEALL